MKASNAHLNADLFTGLKHSGGRPAPVSRGNVPKAPSRGKTQLPLRIARGTSGRSKARWFSKSRPRRAPRQLRPPRQGSNRPRAARHEPAISGLHCWAHKRARLFPSKETKIPTARSVEADASFACWQNTPHKGHILAKFGDCRQESRPKGRISWHGAKRQKQSDVDIFQHSYDLGFFRQSTFVLI